MKKTKFRCYDTKNKKWLFGYDYPNLGGFSFPVGEVVLGGELGSVRLEDWDLIDTMQFTGIKDKSGKEIYEGDIVRFNHYDDDTCQTTDVKQKGVIHGDFGDFNIWLIDWAMDADYGFEIIGNKYDNPELLK